MTRQVDFEHPSQEDVDWLRQVNDPRADVLVVEAPKASRGKSKDD